MEPGLDLFNRTWLPIGWQPIVGTRRDTMTRNRHPLAGRRMLGFTLIEIIVVVASYDLSSHGSDGQAGSEDQAADIRSRKD